MFPKPFDAFAVFIIPMVTALLGVLLSTAIVAKETTAALLCVAAILLWSTSCAATTLGFSALGAALAVVACADTFVSAVISLRRPRTP